MGRRNLCKKLNKQFGQRINNLEVDRKNLKHYTQTIKMILLLKLKEEFPRIPADSKMPGQDKTIGEVFKRTKKWLKDAMNANNNNIEIQTIEGKT